MRINADPDKDPEGIMWINADLRSGSETLGFPLDDEQCNGAGPLWLQAFTFSRLRLLVLIPYYLILNHFPSFYLFASFCMGQPILIKIKAFKLKFITKFV